MSESDMFDDMFPLCILVDIDHIIFIYSDDFSMCRDSEDLEIVDIIKFFSFSRCCTSHTCKFVIELEEILVGNGGYGFGFSLDSDSLFRFDSLMESLAKSPSWHSTTRVLINDENFIISDHVFFAIMITSTSFECILDMMDLVKTEIFVEIFDIQHFF